MQAKPDHFRGTMRKSLVFLLVIVLTLEVRSAAATPLGTVTFLEGLEQSVARIYYRDVDETGYNGLQLTASIARFDSDANAAYAFDYLSQAYAGGYGLSELGATPEAVATPDLGDQTAGYWSVLYFAYLLAWYDEVTVLVTVEGAELYIVEARTTIEEEPAAPSTADVVTRVMEYMLHTEAGEGEGTFGPDGSGSGGVWDRLPEPDGEVLSPLQIDYSQDIQDFPEVPESD
jgi:hypothetical protein